MRTTNAVPSRRRRKRVLKRAKGFWGDRKNHIRISGHAVLRAQASNYSSRKLKKHDFRSLWITRIGIAAKLNGISYSKLIAGLSSAGCLINRKMLADLAVTEPTSFTAVVNKAKAALA